MSIGRVAQPFYTTPMVWDSDYTPEGAVEKLKFTSGPLDIFANFGQFVYQDVTPTSAAAIEGGQNSGVLVGDWSDNNAYMMAWQVGFNYRVDPKLSVKLAPVYYNYIGHGNQSAGFYGPFVGQGIGGFTFNTNTPGNLATTAGSVPGGTAGTNTSFLSPSSAGNSYNQTGINNLSILELPMEINFKIASLDARAFGDYAINLAGNKRAFTAYNTGEAIASQTGNPNPFPHGAQYNQDQAMQFGLAVGNNLDLVYGAKPKKGTWEARVYWQHVEQYALDPNLLDSDFFEGRGNLQGVYVALAYSFSDAIIGTIRYGEAERIDKALGTGGYNADLPLPNPINRFQILQVDATWKF
jgi:hypothetical protein